jgi:hypothetical protein
MTAFDGLILCSAAFLILTLLDAIRQRRWRLLAIQLLVWLVVSGFALVVFREMNGGQVSFGGESSQLWSLVAIIVGAALGIAAQYLFNLESQAKFHWFDMLKPLCISPIVVLPLIASLEGRGTVQPLQIAILWLLAFQNGFFWQAVLDKVRLRVGSA